MRERLEDLEEGEDVKNCECSADRPMPGRVLIAVFCGVCGGYMTHIGGDIDSQVEQLDKVRRVMHTIEAIKNAVAAEEAREAVIEEEGRAWDRRHRHPGCYPPDDGGTASVTMTEVYGGEGFRPFG